MADDNKKKYIKYEETTYILEDSRLPDPTGFDNKVLGVDNGAYVIRDEQGGGGGTGTVKSVNNVQPDANGNVNLSASDVHALPDNTAIPTVPQMATQANMSDWTAGKTVDAATLATDFAAVGNAIAAKYSKPSGGIPASDLAQAVQDKLDESGLPGVTESDIGKVLAVDSNGEWAAESPVIVSGTDAQVTNAVNDYLTQYGVPLRLSEEIKQALLDCFENVAWINDQGQTYYDALYTALYPPVDVLSISAVFNQGSAVIYDTDDLDTLKQYLTVTATYDDSSTGVVTNYTLSGTLTVGTSTITVSYGGKTTTFNVTVSADTFWDFQWDYTNGKLEDQDGWETDSNGGSSELVTGAERLTTTSTNASYFQILPSKGSLLRTMTNGYGILEVVFVGQLYMVYNTPSGGLRLTAAESASNRIGVNEAYNKFRIRDSNEVARGTAIADYQNGTEYTVRLVMKGTTVDIYINGTLVAEDTTPISQSGGANSVFVDNLGSDYYVDLKSLKLKIGSIS